MSDELHGGQPTNSNGAENDNSSNEDLDQDIDFSDDERSSFDEETGKKVSSLSAQKKHWREKYEKQAKEYEDYKKANPQPAPKKEEKTPKESKSDDKDKEIGELRGTVLELTLKQDNPTLSREDLKKAIIHAKAEGVDPQEYINSSFFQAYLKDKADKAAQEGSTPNPSNRSGNRKVNFDNVTPEQISEMSSEEYEKYQKYLMAKEGGSTGGLRVRHTNNM